MNKLLVICGPTATGKTALGLKLAKKFGGEIVNADSRQVYIGMDIITGKFLPEFPISNPPVGGQIPNLIVEEEEYQTGHYLMGKIPLWLVDICRPDQKFSVALFRKLASKVIKNIWKRNKLPIIVGGSGLYIKSLLEPIETMGITPDWELRKKLSNLEIKELKEELIKVDPNRLAKMNESDRNNPRRLTRAIEIALQKQKAKSKKQNDRLKIKSCLILGLKTSNFTKLYRRIDQRVEKRIKAGAEKEVKDLLKHYSWQNLVLGATIGYKEWRDYWAGKATPDEVKRRWQFAEHGYARRQMTWFKKQPGINWLEIDKKSFDREAVNIVQQWYGKN